MTQSGALLGAWNLDPFKPTFLKRDAHSPCGLQASRLQLAYMDLIDALFCEVNPIPVKAALNLMGRDVGGLRLPLCDISPANLEVLRAAMVRTGLLPASDANQ